MVRDAITLTPKQATILELLAAFDYLSTSQICDYLSVPTTKRATEQKLKWLRDRGFIGSERLHPERGAVSELCWWLLRKGADAIAVAGVPFTDTAVIDQKKPQKPDEPDRKALTLGQASVLHLLAEMKQLCPSQICAHLYPDKPKWYTRQMLYSLREHGYARSKPLYPERGAASEHYWILCRRGATMIGVNYDQRYRRRPTRETIKHRGLLLELVRQVEEAGWSLMRPVPRSRHNSCDVQSDHGAYSPQGHLHLETNETPKETPLPEKMLQRRQLKEAVLRKEQRAIESLLQAGYSAASLQDRINRWKAGQVGAVVPRRVNEHVAYMPRQPERTVLLVVHPPFAGRSFWARKPGGTRAHRYRGRSQEPYALPYTGFEETVRNRHHGTHEKINSRVNRYRRLVQVVPVVAVFDCEEVGRQYADLISTAGFKWVVAHEVGEWLRSL